MLKRRSGDYEYRLLPDGTAEILRHVRSEGSLVVPAELDGIPVSALAEYAFDERRNLTSLTISDGIRVIGKRAFWWCTRLRSVTIPPSVTQIGTNAFWRTYKLADIHVMPGNQTYQSLDGVLFSKDGRELIAYPAGKTNARYEIPDGVETIAAGAFAACSALREISLPGSLRLIGTNAFTECRHLERIDFAAGLERIDIMAFSHCYGLSSVTLPEGVTSIGEGAFSHCHGLEAVSFPQTLREIDSSAFHLCESLKEVILPESVTQIGSAAFSECRTLSRVRLPQNLETIRFDLFRNCCELRSIELPQGIRNIDSDAFEGCSSLSLLRIPAGVEKIGHYARSAFDSKLHTILMVDRNSFAEFWAQKNKRPYICADSQDVEKSFRKARLEADSANLRTAAVPGGLEIRGYDGAEKELVIPEQIDGIPVVSIGDRAFFKNRFPVSLTIPQSVTRIGREAFPVYKKFTLRFSGEYPRFLLKNHALIDLKERRLISLMKSYRGEEYTVPEGVAGIGAAAFIGCGWLRKVTFPDGLETIEADAFRGCGGLISLNIPEGVKSVGDRAFENCKQLRTIVLPGSLRQIGENVFFRCRNIERMDCPEVVRNHFAYPFGVGRG